MSTEYSTTRKLTREKPKNIYSLPLCNSRISEGGLRTKGLYKQSSENCPLITVITVVFNGEQHLEETILSVINQNYDNVEYIIIDGGSADGTVELIKKYEDQIDYWVSEEDKGIYDAMNKGWALANNDSRVLYLGAGDKVLSLPEIEILTDELDTIIYGIVELDKYIFNSKVNWKLNLGNTLHHQALLVPKNIHLMPPFNIKYLIYADYDFNLRLYKAGNKFVRSEKFFGYALPDGISAEIDVNEMAGVAMENSGVIVGLLSYIYCSIQSLRVKSTKE